MIEYKSFPKVSDFFQILSLLFKKEFPHDIVCKNFVSTNAALDEMVQNYDAQRVQHIKIAHWHKKLFFENLPLSLQATIKPKTMQKEYFQKS
jgi:hypothetical protein